MNLCLGLEFAGAGLQFCGMMGATDHRKHCYTYYHKKACRGLHPCMIAHVCAKCESLAGPRRLVLHHGNSHSVLQKFVNDSPNELCQPNSFMGSLGEGVLRHPSWPAAAWS